MQRKLRLNLFIISGIFSLFSCKKPKEIPHYQARGTGINAYFPCYPKSYWTYIDSLGNITTIKVDDEYVEYRIKTDDDTINEPYLLPRIKGDYYFSGKKIIRVSGKLYYYYPYTQYDFFEPVVLEYDYDVFNTILLNELIQTQSFVERLDSIIINGVNYDTLIVNKIIFNDPKKTNPILRYFSKNVGLVLEQVIYHQDSIPDTVTIKSLMGYQIFKK